jgi:hypothetical protein
MERVALSLQRTANSHRDEPEMFDLFGRSAFNRYYYAMYLIVRAAVSKMDPRWARTTHGGFAELLSGAVADKISKVRRRAQKLGDAEATALCSKAIHAIHELSGLMKLGYSVRIVSDYRPDIRISESGIERFKIEYTDITTAHEWPHKSKQYSDIILRAWRLSNE